MKKERKRYMKKEHAYITAIWQQLDIVEAGPCFISLKEREYSQTILTERRLKKRKRNKPRFGVDNTTL